MADDSRARLYDLYTAFGRGAHDFVLGHFDDNAEFVSYDPVGIFPYLGRRRGKAQIAETMRQAEAEFEHLSYLPIFTVVEDDKAAVLVMVRLQQRATGRIVQLMAAHFLRFQDGRIVELREFVDTFDAV